MPDFAGPLQRLVLSRTLWLVLAWPIGGLAWQVFFARRRIARASNAAAVVRALASARNASIACTALATASTLAHAVVLARAPRGAALFEHIAGGARSGQFRAEIDLWFDALSATFCVLACVVALAVSAFVATRPGSSRGWQTWGWLQLSLVGALVSFVADGFVGTAIGWSLAGAAGAWLAGWNHPRAAIVSAMRSGVAIGALLVGAVLLFWALGGSWEGDEYLPDAQPHLAAVRASGWSDDDGVRDVDGTSAASPGPDGLLTLTSMSAVDVFVDDARVPSMKAPFLRAAVREGTHALRIRAGDGSSDEVLAHVAFTNGDEIALVPLGPTLTFRAIADQLVLRDREGNTPLRSALQSRAGPGGAAVVATSLIALLVAAGVASGSSSSSISTAALGALAQGATTAGLGPYLLARLEFLFPLAPSTWLAVESVGAAILLGASWRAPALPGARRWLAFVGAAPAALTLLALGAGGVKAALFVMVIVGAATASFHVFSAVSAERFPGAGLMQRSLVDGALLAQGSIADVLLVRAPEHLGALFARMDRWVVGAIADATGALVRAAAWVVSTVDEQVVDAPANLVATKMVRVGREAEPVIGVSLGRVAWTLVVGAVLVALAQALWPGR
jgi:hypothetical protein